MSLSYPIGGRRNGFYQSVSVPVVFGTMPLGSYECTAIAEVYAEPYAEFGFEVAEIRLLPEGATDDREFWSLQEGDDLFDSFVALLEGSEHVGAIRDALAEQDWSRRQERAA